MSFEGKKDGISCNPLEQMDVFACIRSIVQDHWLGRVEHKQKTLKAESFQRLRETQTRPVVFLSS